MRTLRAPGSLMRLVLSYGPNPDIEGGYWSAMKRPTVRNGGFPKPQIVSVASYAEASEVCREYIKRYDLGGGNWRGGDLWLGSKHVAYVSFNGRVWMGDRDADGSEVKI